MSVLSGRSFVGGARGGGDGEAGTGFDPKTGEALEPVYRAATMEEIARAGELAETAFRVLRATSGEQRAGFLEAVASGLEVAADAIVARAMAETALPEARLRTELGRTSGQLRAFAALAREGAWVEERLDPALPDRQPLPRPEIRSRRRPIGPVAVFCASNFPLAFSVAGGDSAAAWAVGCPVLVHAHIAHPGTAELVAGVVAAAVAARGLPEGTFSLLFGAGHEVGQAMVKLPQLAAVAFTGSRRGGLALVALATERPRPIPVFAEMGSVNPVVILPGALGEFEALAAGLFGSMTLGCGQFCTQPGLVFLPAGEAGDRLLQELRAKIEATAAMPLLTAAIRDSFVAGLARRKSLPGVETTLGLATPPEGGFWVRAALQACSAETFAAHPELADELFGPASLVVRFRDEAELLGLLSGLEGQLTVTIHAGAGELVGQAELLLDLEAKAGRLVFGGFPTGVEVVPAMVHGGPWPATSDGRSTSVGTASIERFVRRVAWQNAPLHLW